jgi:hypothetical protein
MNWFRNLFSRKQSTTVPVELPPAFAFCENQAAGSTSPWHIRRLTEKGKKLGGGADTPALCGHIVHWDRAYPLTRVAVFLLRDSVCHQCSELYMETTKPSNFPKN